MEHVLPLDLNTLVRDATQSSKQCCDNCKSSHDVERTMSQPSTMTLIDVVVDSNDRILCDHGVVERE
jgi:hypothetical protein